MVMSLTPYIIQLLEREETALIPGLGTFSISYRPAVVDITNHRFSPPSRRVSYSVATDTGVSLVRELAMVKQISEEEAEKQVREFVQHVLYVLRQDEPYVLTGLGSLRQLSTGNVVFIADPAFEAGGEFTGFEPFTLEPVVSQEKIALQEEEVVQPPPQEGQPDTPLEEVHEIVEERKPKPNRSGVVFGWLVVFLGVVLLVLAWMHRERIEEAVTSLTNQQPAQQPLPQVAPEDTARLAPTDTSTVIQDTLLESMPATDSMETTLQASPEPEPIISGPRYYIVAGAFREEEKATKFVAELIAKGYKASVFEQTAGGLNVVSYGVYPDPQEANTALQQIRQQENPSAWIKKVSPQE